MRASCLADAGPWRESGDRLVGEVETVGLVVVPASQCAYGLVISGRGVLTGAG